MILQPNRYAIELQIASRAVHLASLLTKQHLLTYQSAKSHVSEETKSDASEVTVADFAAQAVIISIVHHAFPDDEFIAEESSDMLRGDEKLATRVWELVCSARILVDVSTGEVKLPNTKEEMMNVIDLGQQGGSGVGKANRTWILDPIDGTKTYIRAQQYAVCLCLVDEGEQKVAVLGCSNLNLEQKDAQGSVVIREDVVDLDPKGGWMLSAVKGQGTYLERINQPGKRVRAEDVVGNGPAPDGINGHEDSTQAQGKIKLRFTDSSASPHISKDLHNAVFEHFLPPAASRKLSTPAVPEGYASLALDLWSMQLKYVILALRGSGADAMIRTPPYSTYHAAVWDHAGGQLLLTESGGVLTDANGSEFVVNGRMRKLEKNWGVCATRGGLYGDGITAKQAHEVVLGKVKEIVGQRRMERLKAGEDD